VINWKSLKVNSFLKRFSLLVSLILILVYWPKPSVTLPLPEPSSPPPLITLLFVGDLSFDRHIRESINTHDYTWPLKELTDFLQGFDLVIVNLESPITNNPSISLGSIPGEPRNFSFTSSPETAVALAENNIRLVNLGNNHILNFGSQGLAQTKKYLIDNQIDYFGNTGQPTSDRTIIKTINQLKLGFVNYNQFTKGGFEATREDLMALRSQVDVLIVFCHWGEEYQPVAGIEIQSLAHQFIELGADLVIGTHPHVIQQQEIYQGQPIYYSLGNFVFDQYFQPETKKGLLVGVTLNPESLTFTGIKEYYVEMLPSGQTAL